MLFYNTAIEEQKSLLQSRHAEWERENGIFERKKEEDMNEISKLVETYEKETVDTIWEHSENHRSMKRDLETKLQVSHSFFDYEPTRQVSFTLIYPRLL
jgi:hypothetical protein